MPKIIVDTSVWIDFFRGRLKPIVRHGLEVAAERDQIVITDIIKHEILIGAPSKREWTSLTDILSPLDVLSISAAQCDKFNEFAWQLRLNGLRGSYTDTAIAYLSSAYKYPILSLDRYFKLLAQKGIISTISF